MVIKMVSMILGGGVGSRLYPLTSERSKPAVPIGGKYRLIDIPISNCLNSGVRRMFVLTQFNSASLNQHIKNTYHFDHFSRGFVDILAAEQSRGGNDWYQGTADAVRQCMRHLHNHEYDFILILSGDQLYQMDFEALAKYHIEQNADLTVATIPVNAESASGFGIMKVGDDGMIKSFIEKPSQDLLPEWSSPVSAEQKEQGKIYLASMGIYIFSANAIDKLFNDHQDSVDFGKEIIPAAITGGYRVASYIYDGYWEDIGTIKAFFECNIALTEDIPEFNLFDNQNVIFTRPRMLGPSKIFGTKFNKAVVAEGCFIHAALVENSLIGIRSRIGEGAIIKNSILFGNDYFETLEALVDPNEVHMGVGRNCHIERCIIDKDCRIGDGVSIIGHPDLEDSEADTHIIVDGIIVLKKGAEIPAGSKIGHIE